MVKQPKFSIIVPIYNVEKYLSYCLESIIKQTVKDIEIICVNDGSTDNSLSILTEFAKIDDRIQIVNKANGGLSSARNIGLDVANGEYILFVDSDDMIKENTCDRLYMEMLQTNADVVVFGTEVFPWREADLHPWFKDVLRVDFRSYEGNCLKALFNENSSKPFVWNECYKREIIEQYNIRFDESLRYGEDMIFLFNIFPRISRIVYLPDVLYMYRCGREGSLMDNAAKNVEYKVQMHMQIVEKILADWYENGFLEQEMDSLYLWCLEFVLGEFDVMPLTETFKKETVKNYQKLLGEYGLNFRQKRKEYKLIEKKLQKIMN